MLFKKIISSVVCLVLVSCGWQPVYYRNDSAMPIQTAYIDVLPVPEASGRLFVQQLKDSLNPQNENVEKRYILSVSLSEEINKDQGILGDNTSTRATMRITARFQLKEKNKLLLNDSSFVTSSYNILMLPYPTVTAQKATRDRLIDMLADKVAMRLAVYFENLEQEE